METEVKTEVETGVETLSINNYNLTPRLVSPAVIKQVKHSPQSGALQTPVVLVLARFEEGPGETFPRGFHTSTDFQPLLEFRSP